MLEAEVGSNVLLGAVSPTGTTGLFPRAVVRDSAGAAIAASPVDLTQDLGDGAYQDVLVAPLTEGYYSVVTTFYQDAGHTIVAGGEPVLLETLRVVVPPSVAQVNFAFDEAGQQLFAEVWLERKGQVVLAPTSCAVTLRDKDEANIASLASATPQASNGVFNIEQAGVILADNRPYNALVSVTDALGTVVTVHSLSTVA